MEKKEAGEGGGGGNEIDSIHNTNPVLIVTITFQLLLKC